MNQCDYYPDCSLPQKSEATVAVNDTEVCYDAWNVATQEERGWIEKVTGMYNQGLLTRKDLSDYMHQICYHHHDPTIPIHI